VNGFAPLQLQQAQIFLGGEFFEGGRFKTRGDNALDEKFGEFLGGGRIEWTIDGDDSAERGDRIAG
jgi:hypothetical protein